MCRRPSVKTMLCGGPSVVIVQRFIEQFPIKKLVSASHQFVKRRAVTEPCQHGFNHVLRFVVATKRPSLRLATTVRALDVCVECQIRERRFAVETGGFTLAREFVDLPNEVKVVLMRYAKLVNHWI